MWTTVHGAPVYARVQGAGPPLVLVPGLACSHRVYTRLQAQLAAHFEVWAYDPPGHGRTPASPEAYLSVEALTAHLAAWLRATGLEGAPLFGHSLGGEVLLHLGASWPELASHLVLCAPSGHEETARTPRLLRRLLLDARYERPGFLVRLARSYCRTGVRRSWTLLRAGRQDMTFRLAPRVRVPVLILEGDLDRVVRREALLKLSVRLPDARRVRLTGGGHALHDRRAPEVAHLIAAFIQRDLVSPDHRSLSQSAEKFS